MLVAACEVFSDPNSNKWSVTVTWPENGEMGSLEILSACNNLYSNINTLPPPPPHLQQDIVHGRFLLLPLMLKFFLDLQAARGPLAENGIAKLFSFMVVKMIMMMNNMIFFQVFMGQTTLDGSSRPNSTLLRCCDKSSCANSLLCNASSATWRRNGASWWARQGIFQTLEKDIQANRQIW